MDSTPEGFETLGIGFKQVRGLAQLQPRVVG
jgi:hypothetical protein